MKPKQQLGERQAGEKPNEFNDESDQYVTVDHFMNLGYFSKYDRKLLEIWKRMTQL